MKLLFICTHNRCRSILAEAICKHEGGDLLQAYSAGNSPVGEVHPLTIGALEALSIPTSSLKSESWDAFETADIDYVITVCDKAANEPCPLWFGKTRQVHWGLVDPSAVKGEPELITAAFDLTIEILRRRIKQVKSWIEQGLDEEALYEGMKALGLEE